MVSTFKKEIKAIIFMLLVAGLVIMYLNSRHDHKVYERKHPNGVHTFTFIICGDSTLVTKDNGTHIGYIPESYDEFITKENRIR